MVVGVWLMDLRYLNSVLIMTTCNPCSVALDFNKVPGHGGCEAFDCVIYTAVALAITFAPRIASIAAFVALLVWDWYEFVVISRFLHVGSLGSSHTRYWQVSRHWQEG